MRAAPHVALRQRHWCLAVCDTCCRVKVVYGSLAGCSCLLCGVVVGVGIRAVWQGWSRRRHSFGAVSSWLAATPAPWEVLGPGLLTGGAERRRAWPGAVARGGGLWGSEAPSSRAHTIVRTAASQAACRLVRMRSVGCRRTRRRRPPAKGAARTAVRARGTAGGLPASELCLREGGGKGGARCRARCAEQRSLACARFNPACSRPLGRKAPRRRPPRPGTKPPPPLCTPRPLLTVCQPQEQARPLARAHRAPARVCGLAPAQLKRLARRGGAAKGRYDHRRRLGPRYAAADAVTCAWRRHTGYMCWSRAAAPARGKLTAARRARCGPPSQAAQAPHMKAARGAALPPAQPAVLLAEAEPLVPAASGSQPTHLGRLQAGMHRSPPGHRPPALGPAGRA